MEEEIVKKKFNLIPFFAEALARTHHVWDDIIQFYKTNEIEFYKAWKKSEFKNNYLANCGTIETDEIYSMILGIIECSACTDDEKIANQLFFLFKKAYGKLYRAYKRYDFDYKPFMNELLDLCGEVGDDEFICNVIATIFFSNNAEIATDKFIIEFLNTKEILYNRENLNAKGLPKEFKEPIDKILRQIPKALTDSLHNYESRKKMIRLCGEQFEQISILLEFLGLEASMLYDGIFESDDLKIIAYTFYIEYERTELKKEDYITILIMLLLVGMSRNFKKSKEYHKKHSAGTKIETICDLQNQVKALKKSVQEQESLKRELKTQRQREEKLIQENEELRKQLQKMQLQVANSEFSENELYRLREFAYNSTNSEEILYKEPIEDFAVLNKLLGVIIGGHPNWTKKIKKYLPNWKFVSADVSTIDSSFLVGKVVVINTSFLHHSLYYSIIDTLRRENITFGYVNNQVNIKRSLRQIKEIVKL